MEIKPLHLLPASKGDALLGLRLFELGFGLDKALGSSAVLIFLERLFGSTVAGSVAERLGNLSGALGCTPIINALDVGKMLFPKAFALRFLSG